MKQTNFKHNTYIATICMIAVLFGSVAFATPSAQAQNSNAEIRQIIETLLKQISLLQAKLEQIESLEGGYKGESFSIGDQVATTNTLNVRASAGADGRFLVALPANTKGTIVGGPENKNGYLWWKVSYGSVTGWSAHNWLRATGVYTAPKESEEKDSADLEESELSVRIVKPNSGSYEYGEKITVAWEQIGSVPNGSKACVNMVNIDTNRRFAFPGTGGCVGIAGAEPIRTVKGEVVRTSGYDMAPGKYKLYVTLIGPSDPAGKDGKQLAIDSADDYVYIKEKRDEEPESNVSSGELHALVASVYKGTYPDGVTNGPDSHPQGAVDVYVADNVSQEQNIILVLSSYEPVKWNVRGPGAQYIKKVLVTGYYNQEVVGLAKSVPIDSKTYEGGSSDFFLTFDRSDEGDLNEYLEEAYDARPIQSSSGYTLEVINFDLGKG